jgi:O-antigen ligase
MEDISTVERFYRWVAGINMIEEKPLTGFGPSTFYSNYKSYTVTSYKTYVSDNPEKSGIHNYYLMTAVEQGIPGLLIFVGLCMICILCGEQAFHALKNKEEKALVMAATVSFVLVLAVLIINDLIEADKVGPLFFLSASIIAFYSIRAKELKDSEELEA